MLTTGFSLIFGRFTLVDIESSNATTFWPFKDLSTTSMVLFNDCGPKREELGEIDSTNLSLVFGRQPAMTNGFSFEYFFIFEIILCSVVSFTAHVTMILRSEFFLLAVI
jgi:hypothetical protein